MIFGDWYPALRADGLKRGETALAMLLGIPMLLGRKADGALFALRDLCPHRGIPLSAGWFDGETVQCKYHGWRFEPCSGRCEEIPSLTSFDSLEPTKIFANAFPVVESDGYAWVYVPEPGAGRVKRKPRCRRCRSCRSSPGAIAARTCRPSCRATWTTASSG